MTIPFDQFEPSGIHLDNPSVGLPPRVAKEALIQGINDWSTGQITAPSFDVVIARSREAFASIVECPVDWVAITTPVSVASGCVATLLKPGDRVLVAEEDFTSIIFPFLERGQDGIVVDAVPLDRIIETISADHAMVAVSAAQSSDGRLIDLDALAAKASLTNTLTYVDVTQAAGWVEIDATMFDVTSSGIYKWLCSPRGAGFMTVAPHLWDRMRNVAAGWYAGDNPWTSVYGLPLRQASNARKFDVSPGWICWVGAAPALELLAEIGPAEIGAHNVGLTNRVRSALGLAESNQAVISLDLEPGQVQALRDKNVSFAERAGRSRLGFHLYNTEADVDAVLSCLS